ncbi:uncharacterized protein LOC134910198 isoform X2 [Pseudophryne corroboree]|uniref:uncharacterized protein LOC134910198 isoform X2 n=1 Tax=Pseudophryne corroboree TaxID=495146 RepID=UPI003082126B
METWGRDAEPSTSQTSGGSFRSDNEAHLSSEMLHSDLPGHVTSYFDELTSHPSCIIKSIAIDNDSLESPEKQDESWLSKIGSYRSKLAFLNCWNGAKEDTAEPKRDLHKFTKTYESRSLNELAECEEHEGQPYIPYDLAKIYITKIVNDMQQMKIKHMEVIKETDGNARRNQENVILILRNHYRAKMNILKTRLEVYHDIMEKKTAQFQDRIKDLEIEREQLINEKSSLLFEISELKEKLEHEKA